MQVRLADYPQLRKICWNRRADALLDGAEALVICTEWPEFRNPDFDYLKHKLKQPLIFDGRNLWEAQAMRDRGFEYHGIGLKA